MAENDHRTLIDELLAQQRSLTAVTQFARRHDQHELPAQAKFYRDLLPLAAPQPGQQYAFEVNLDQCSGCKACVTACHSLNGLDDEETWRSVGLLYSDDWRAPFQATVTTACHHCVDPGCLNGCPVLAYDKDPVTGIVRHLDDQCIGCQYCVMKCPYEVPKYSARRGIVRKCDMCSNRLAAGEAPACVQACPNEAIRITVVEQRAVAEQFRTPSAAAALLNPFLPASPRPAITVPTTRYISSKPLPANLLAGDHVRATPAYAHLPLVFMLVLTQLAVGASVASLFVGPAQWLTLAALVVGAGALGVASLHLGRPLKAWRAFLGWRRSWFSREVIVFGGFVPLAAAAALAAWRMDLPGWLGHWLAPAAALTGLMGVACSAMIYADTGREYWRAAQCFGKFFGTTILLGAATALALGHWFASLTQSECVALALILSVTSVAKLGFERRIFLHLVDEETPAPTPLNKTARLLTGELGLLARVRVALTLVGGVLLPLVQLLGRTSSAPLVCAALALCVAGELLERYLFFTAVAPAKMPGGITA